ncbi:MAG TPA: LysR family transcriptional regulator [Hyphomicrobiales bacterium]|nr:LysR family transcriptional regulator [Hyphomicrobiales bacterium]
MILRPAALDWSHYRSLLAVLDHGSLSGAARALGLTQPTVGRHIDALQAALGQPLFTRSPQGLRPTETALELRPHAEAMAAAAAALERTASGGRGEARGTVRITASEMVGAEVLPPILADFRERHPAIAVELVLSNRTADLLRRDADIAVRMIEPTQDALVVRHIGTVALHLYAHRRYLAAHGVPADLDDLAARHAIIGFDRNSASAAALRERGLTLMRDLFALRTDSDLAQLAALRAGFGIGVCQAGIARRDEALVPVLASRLSFALGIWLAVHEDLRGVRRIRLAFDALAAGLGRYVAGAGPEAGGA